MADKIKTLTNLQRVAKHKVENVQKQLATVMGAIQALNSKIETLQQRLQDEATIADADIHLLTAYENFAKRTKETIKNLQKEKQNWQQEEQEHRKALATHFAEEKRYEILLTKALEDVKKQRAKKQQQQLDEIAGIRAHKR